MVDGTAGVPPLGLGAKLAFGVGAAANGVKNNGFGYFLLIFYVQVIGVDSRLVSLAIFIALLVDAFIDPAIGYASDNWRSRWGRRHPFMYAAALPVAVLFYFLWNPPQGWSQEALFWWILCLSVLIRAGTSTFETPNQALGAELSTDYDQRSGLFGFRLFFGWTVGNFMSALMFLGLFPALTTAAGSGQFDPRAYAIYGAVGAGVMFVAMLVSAAGTHARIPYLPKPPPKRRVGVLGAFREIFQTLSDKSFVALFVAAMLGAIAGGLSAALAFYFLSFFWGFTPIQQGLIILSVFGSAIIGSSMVPVVSRKMGKKRGAMVIGLVAFIGSPLPVLLALVGVLPKGEPWVFWVVLVATMVDVGLIICFSALSAAMMADLVERAELRTGRRNEGVFYATSSFIQQAVAGVGVLIAGWILFLAGIPEGARPGQVDAAALWNLGAYYVPTILTLWMAMMGAIALYRVSRAEHEDNLRRLAAARAGAE